MVLCNFKTLGPSWKVGSTMVCDGAQREFFARKKPCPLQANSGFYHPPTSRAKDPVTFEKDK